MSDPDERAPLFEARPDDEALTRAVKNLLGPSAMEAWVGQMKIRMAADERIQIDGNRGLGDLTDSEAAEIIASSNRVTDMQLEDGRLRPEKYLDPKTNAWSPANIVENKDPGRDPD